VVFPEQREMSIRDPSQLPKARLPNLPPPRTVADREPPAGVQNLTLDDAIRTGLANAEVIRVLAGTTAVSSGRTIYDPAISNTQIDQERGRFDPTFQILHNYQQSDFPVGVTNPVDPMKSLITGVRTNEYAVSAGLSQTTPSGGTAAVNVQANPSGSNAEFAPLNPEAGSQVDLSYTQPLLQGGGARVNLAPMVIAGIDTERSFFQTKDSVQELVNGVVQAYWTLVFARFEVWVRQQQVQQGQEALDLAEAKRKAQLGSGADAAQARATLANFRASLVSARAVVLDQEAALCNILGLPPPDSAELVPTTPVSTDRFTPNWNELLRLAEERRPDLIELKLILEADQQRLLLANNQALPSLDATGLYRWNGLTGKMPNGGWIASDPGQFTGWQFGVTFSVPLGLRQARAGLRQQELLIMHDRANLQQGLHAAGHDLATSVRNVAQYYEQYLAYKENREAVHVNLDVQRARYRQGLAILLNVLQAMTDWGNAVDAEVGSLIRYNAELANLERLTGTILETHGVRFVEERYGSIGPLGRFFADRCYPQDMRPGPNQARYPAGTQPAEAAFQEEIPLRLPGSATAPDGAAQPPARPEVVPPGTPAPLPPR